MKKFLHFGMVTVNVVLLFCVKCDEKKKALFLKSSFCCLNIYIVTINKSPKLKEKTKKEMLVEISEKTTIIGRMIE